MNAVYVNRQHKLFTNALSCLSRFSDKLSIRCSQPDESGYAIRLSAINPAGSAFCAFCFLPDFFEHYELDRDRRRADLVLNIRTLQNVLKTQFNKKLEKCELILIEDDTESRLAVRLHSFNGVTKTHKLTYEDQRGKFPAAPEEASKIVMDAKTVQGILEHFGTRTNGEIALSCKSEDLIIKSRNDDFIDRSAKMGKSVWTEVKVDSRHFKVYKIKAEVELTFAMREFKAAIALADHLMLPLELSFSHAGGPLIIKVQCPSMMADVFIATSPAPEHEESQGQGMEERQASQTSVRQQRQETEAVEGEKDDIGEMGDLGHQNDSRAAAELVQSGRSAARDADVPLQSTAPRGHPQREGSPSLIATLPRSSSKSPSPPRDGLFLGESSPREISNDTAMDAELERVMQAAEAQEDQRRQSQVVASQSGPAEELDLDDETMQESVTLREEDMREDNEDEYAATDDEEGIEEEEEIPSTQQEAGSKRARYVPLF